LVVAGLLALAACGSPPAPDTGDNKADAGGVELPAVDSGTAGSTDAGGSTSEDAGRTQPEVRTLRLVGPAEQDVDTGATAALRVQLVATETGVVIGAPITFTLKQDASGGALGTTAVNTDEDGVAEVVFTAGKKAGLAVVTIAADGKFKDKPVEAKLNVKAAVRTLSSADSALTLPAGRTVAYEVQLTGKGGKPVSSAKVTFTAKGDKKSILLDGASAATQTVTTALDGTASIALTAGTVPVRFSFDVEASAEFATPIKVTINAIPRAITGGGCASDAECAAGQTCVNTACVKAAGCTSDADCTSGFTCSPSGQCVKATTTGCTQSSECTGLTYCDTSLKKCVAGCDADSKCVSPKICDKSRHVCVAPTSTGCTDDSECPTGMVCNGTKCVLAPPTSTGCADSSECDAGKYCDANLGKCVPGCDDDSQCATKNCDLDSNTCGAMPPCQDDSECTGGEVCSATSGKCEPPPPVIFDVTTDWHDVTHHFNATSLVPPSVSNVLNTLNQAFGMLENLVSGNAGDLLPSIVPSSIKKQVSKAVDGVVKKYVPSWVKDAILIGANINNIIHDLTVKSAMKFEQKQPDKSKVTGSDTWNKLIWYWYKQGCTKPAAGKPPPSCAEVAIDLKALLISPGPSNFAGDIKGTTLNIGPHSLNVKIGKAVEALLKLLLEALTGDPDLAKAIKSVVDCAAINTELQDLARSILPSSLEHYADKINIVKQCNDGIDKAAQAVHDKIANLAPINTPVSLSGRATITQDPGNGSNLADHLINGVWDGSIGSTQKTGIGTWNAERGAEE
jgi:hypothetical protein